MNKDSSGLLQQMLQGVLQNIPEEQRKAINVKDLDSMIAPMLNGVTQGLNKQEKDNFNSLYKGVLENVSNVMSNQQPIQQQQVQQFQPNQQFQQAQFQQQVQQVQQQPNQQVQKVQSLKVPERIKNYEELDSDSDVDPLRPRTKDIVISLNVSLEELYSGTSKKLAIPRKRIVKDGKREKVVEEDKKIVVPIEKGMRDGQYIRYNKQGHEYPGYDTGDIVIDIKENGHSTFEREGNNLYVVVKISLFESYAAAENLISLTIRTLDGRFLVLDAGGVPLHVKDGLRKIVGEGMPKHNDEGNGDLYIRFNVILPEKIEELEQLKHLFVPIQKEVVYNDGSNKSFDLLNRKVTNAVLQEVTEEDLEKLNYNEEEESDDDDDDEYDDEEESEEESEESEEEIEEPVKKKNTRKINPKKS